MPLINCEINLILHNRQLGAGAGTFAINDKKLYVPVVTLSNQDNVKLLKRLKSGVGRKMKWNKYQSQVSIQRQNWHLDYLIDPSF